eukprot:COSAG06_NODE_62153_length_265_cov_5.704819_1_plen_64_part_10
MKNCPSARVQALGLGRADFTLFGSASTPLGALSRIRAHRRLYPPGHATLGARGIMQIFVKKQDG